MSLTIRTRPDPTSAHLALAVSAVLACIGSPASSLAQTTSITIDASWGRTPASVGPGAAGTTLTGNRGAVYSVPGHLFTIGESVGRVAGANLFHSFGTFSVGAGDAAVFTTDTATLKNVISRVSGNAPTSINGGMFLLPAPGSNPNFYFINPNGVTFGRGAQVDVPAAFRISTAQSLKFTDGMAFVAGNGSDSTLTIAAPAAFGFLGSRAAAPVSFNASDGSGDRFQVAMPPGTDLDLTAGSVQFDSIDVQAQAAAIRAVATGSAAVDVPIEGRVGAPLDGAITFNQSSLAAWGGGSILLEGGPISLRDTLLEAVGTEGPPAGPITLVGDGDISFDATVVQSYTDSPSDSGAWLLRASGEVLLLNGSYLSSTAYGIGTGARIEVQAPTLTLDDPGAGCCASMGTASLGEGHAGDITIDVDTLRMRGQGGIVTATQYGSGKAGDITVTGRDLSVGGQGISSRAEVGSSGRTGSITLQASESLAIEGRGVYLMNLASVDEPAAVTPASIFITTPQLTKAAGARFGAFAYGNVAPGSVWLNGTPYVPAQSSQISIDGSWGRTPQVLDWTDSAITNGAPLRIPGNGTAQHFVTGNVYTIPESHGKVAGNNLFHSFEAFTLVAGDAAIFTTVTSRLENVIGRVSGQSPTLIEGLLALVPAEGSHPNLYLINPAGVMFGVGALLDLPASFHVATANHLIHADGTLFRAGVGADAVLTAAGPSTFGFDERNTPAMVGVGGLNLPLALTEGAGLSLVAGAVLLDSAAISLTGGLAHLAAVGTDAAEVPILEAASGPLNGTISALNGSTLSTTGSGALLLEAGSILVQGSEIRAENWTSLDAGTVRLISSGDIAFDSGYLYAWGDLTASQVSMKAGGTVSVIGGAIYSFASGASGAAAIEIEGNAVVIGAPGSGGGVESGGAPGAISITAATDVTIASGGVLSNNYSMTDATAISISAGSDISIENGAVLTTSQAAGAAADIRIQAGALTLSGGAGDGSIQSQTYSMDDAGSAGDIWIYVRNSTRIANGSVASYSFGTGAAGRVEMHAGEPTGASPATVHVVDSTISGAPITILSTGDLSIERLALQSMNRVRMQADGTLSATDVTLNGEPFVIGPPPASPIRLDGSWGRAPREVELDDHFAYTIAEADGVVAGANLFHSFDYFSVGPGDAAIFTTVTPTLENVIARVSGSSPSLVQGLLALEPAVGSQPDFFIINPAGVTFASGAQVDVPAAFHLSSANSIAFADGTRFPAGKGSDAFVSLEGPISLGFEESQSPVPVMFVGPGLPVALRAGAELSIIAGSVSLDSTHLQAPEGAIHIAATGTDAVEIFIRGAAGVPLGGAIELSHGSALSTGSGGAILLEGGPITIQGGQIQSGMAWSPPGDSIKLVSSSGMVLDASFLDSGSIALSAVDSLEISGSHISSQSMDGAQRVEIRTGDADSAGTGSIQILDSTIAGAPIIIRSSGDLSVARLSLTSPRAVSISGQGPVSVTDVLLNGRPYSLPAPRPALIRLDGSWGRAPRDALLDGAVYIIAESDGVVAGANLFHSFEYLSVGPGEEAIFTTVTPTLKNVIARVSGSSPSLVQGLLALEPAAGSHPDFFLVNPAGVAFGAGAQIDLPAAFHVSTANGLGFSNGSTIWAGTGVDEIVALTEPSVMLFLGGQTVAPILFSGLDPDGGPAGGLDLPMRSGSDITISAGTATFESVALTVPDGGIRVMATGTDAVQLPAAGPVDTLLRGAIDLTQATLVTSGAGSISLLGGSMQLRRSQIRADSVEAGAPRPIALVSGGDITFHETIVQATPTPGALSERPNPMLVAAAGDVTLGDRAQVVSVSNGMTASHGIEIRAHSLLVTGESFATIGSSTYNSPAGSGPVSITATDSVHIGRNGRVSTGAHSGTAGSITIEGRSVSVRGGDEGRNAQITSSSFSGGHAGSIAISATDDVSIANGVVSTTNYPSGIAGPISIRAGASDPLTSGSISIRNSYVSSYSDAGAAGNVTVSGRLVDIADTTLRAYGSGRERIDIQSEGDLAISNLTLQTKLVGPSAARFVRVSAGGTLNLVAVVLNGEPFVVLPDSPPGDESLLQIDGSWSRTPRRLDWTQSAEQNGAPIELVGNDGARYFIGGSVYTIAERDGKLAGNNLFHSFEHFGLEQGDAAVFTTITPTIENVISRVSGRSPSVLNGLLALVPAEGSRPRLFFINPSGVTFASSAQLDVPAAFHVSTANGLGFHGGARYSAGTGADAAFTHEAPLTLQFDASQSPGSVVFAAGAAPIVLPRGGALSAVAGMVQLQSGGISAPEGWIRLAATGKDAVAVPIGRAADVALGGALVADDATLATTRTGSILLEAGSVVLRDSWIRSDNPGSSPAGPIMLVSKGDIVLDRAVIMGASTSSAGVSGDTTSISVQAGGALSMLNGAQITLRTDPFSKGAVGTIDIMARSLSIDAGSPADFRFSGIYSSAGQLTTGDGGAIRIGVAQEMSLRGGIIHSAAFWDGSGGPIDIHAGSLVIDGGFRSAGSISSEAGTNASRSGGSITVDIDSALNIFRGGKIQAGTAGSGSGGAITVRARSLEIDGRGVEAGSFGGTGIFSDGMPFSGGNAGTISVYVTDRLSILDQGRISASTYDTGIAGAVEVRAKDIAIHGNRSGILAEASSGSSGRIGSLTVTASDSLSLSDQATISVRNEAAYSNPGGATTLRIAAQSISLKDATITAESTGSADASNIHVEFGGRLVLDPSSITTSAKQGNGGDISIEGQGLLWLDHSRITTSVTGPEGDGGDISVSARTLLMETGFIQANTAAPEALGGDVSIDVTALLSSGALLVGGQTPFEFDHSLAGMNVIQAAAPDGVSGNIRLATPALDIAGDLSRLTTQIVDPAPLAGDLCRRGAGSSLTPIGRGGLRPTAFGTIRPEPGALRRSTSLAPAPRHARTSRHSVSATTTH